MKVISSKLLTSPLKWALGSWSLFIAENFVLSENRTYLINAVGDDNYHYMYGTCSTAAVGSIVYGYFYKVRGNGPFRWVQSMPMPLYTKIIGFIALSAGLGLVSQTAPKFQLPLAYTADNENSGNQSTASKKSASKNWKVRCPFDFTHPESKVLDGGIEIRGVDRITRHSGLWSFGLVGLGAACLTPSIPTSVFYSMPLMVALLGGAHTDSRHRRGMGGNLRKDVDAKTSNVPFAAIISGNDDGIKDIIDETKGLNLLVGVGIAGFIVMTKGRGRQKFATNRRLTN